MKNTASIAPQGVRTLVATLIATLSLLLGIHTAQASSSSEYAVQNGSETRKYIVYVPTSYDSNQKTPLVLFFHGGEGDMVSASQNYGWQQKSEQSGFIVAFLNGASPLQSGKLATWNAGNCCSYARNTNSNDVGFTQVAIQDLKSKFNIDADRIFATGFSNGGMLSHRLACEMAGTFRAIAAVAGTDNTISCSPAQPVPVLHIHALDDDHVLFNGGVGPAFNNPGQVTDFTSVAETAARWVNRDHLSATSTRVLSVPGAYCDLYTSTQTSVQVKVCVTETGGHSWPGSGQSGASQAISGNDMIWSFFQAQSTALPPTSPVPPVTPPVTPPATPPTTPPTVPPVTPPTTPPTLPPAAPPTTPTSTSGGVITNAKPITGILTNILNFLLSVLGVIGIIGLVTSGILYLTAGGDEGRLRLAKRIVTASGIGLIIALGSLVVVTQLTSFLT